MGLGLALTRPVSAADACRIEVKGAEADVWGPAARAIDVEIREQRLESRCTLITLLAESGRAWLTFTADDGRRAERLLEDPIELLPTIQALSVAIPTLEAEPSTKAAAKQPARSSPRKVSVSGSRRRAAAVSPAHDDGAEDATAPNPYALSPIFGAAFGVRGGANRLISPTVSGTIALGLDRWELGLIGRFEAHYAATTGDNEGRPDTSGIVVGPTFGFRKPLRRLTLRGGGMLLLAALEEDGGGKNGRAEGRIGAYFGGVYPDDTRFRFRLDLGAELVPYNLGRSEQNASGEWSLPWWATTCSLGIELG